jgi:hypothetical protein
MNKNELKKVLKPLIKECIKEVIFEKEGALSHIISEVMKSQSGTSSQTLTKEEKWIANAKAASNPNALQERKRQILDAIGADAYGGVNIFEGTTPAPAPEGNTQGALSGVEPNDPGVNINGLVSAKSNAIFKRMMEKK